MSGELSGKQVAVLVDNYYQELEVWYPLLRMREAGAEVFTVGPEAGATYKSKLGYPVKADRAIADVGAGDFDALVIPGGWAPDHMRRNPRFARLIADADQAAKPIGAICHGAWMLWFRRHPQQPPRHSLLFHQRRRCQRRSRLRG